MRAASAIDGADALDDHWPESGDGSQAGMGPDLVVDGDDLRVGYAQVRSKVVVGADAVVRGE
ncbi:MAG: hypothetical protein GY698_06215 [Actinomycetia bacterium]|nr:hypothetical protein [Actinomycetes bacterium]